MSTTHIEQLYRMHGPAVLSYLRSSFAWCAAPEDLLQETFLNALRREGKLGEAVSARAYLFGIARNVGLTAARRRRPEARLAEINPAAIAASAQLLDLREAIALLAPAMREALELKLKAGLSYEEIAQVLEIPVGTVRSRLHTALQNLRKALHESE